MFPDFLKTKEKLENMLDYAMKMADSIHMGQLANVPVSIIFEGNRFVVVREDGSIEETKAQKITAELPVRVEEIENMSDEMIFEKINNVTKEIAKKKSELFSERLDKLTDETGNVVSADGKRSSIDAYLELLEKMEIDFDEAGNPKGLTPFPLSPAIAKIISQAKVDPRYQDLMERKREECRVRESRRTLVG